MSLPSILQRIQNKGKLPATLREETKPNATINKPLGTISSSTKGVDPVVARLKELRRQENEKKLQVAREKKGLPPAKPKPVKPKAQASQSKSNPQRRQQEKLASPVDTLLRTQPAPPVKRLKFQDLMKKAAVIEKSNLSINLKQVSPELKNKGTPKLGAAKPGQTSRPLTKPLSRNLLNNPIYEVSRNRLPKSTNALTQAPKLSKAPIPLRKPSAVLESKLKTKKPSNITRRRQYESEEEEDEELKGFVVSDEEESARTATDYDRDEIWAIFNKGKKRTYNYDDYDSDDMEATGAEILDEEDRSKRNAEIEDRREAMEEARRAALKEAKRMKRNQ